MSGVKAALAGRRIDAADADVTRFPLAAISYVAAELEHLFRHEAIDRIICSAACGADILALEAAEALDIRATIVLPFASQVFRKSSVMDRPGDWGERYDRLVDDALSRGDLLDMALEPNDPQAYDKATAKIVALARDAPAVRRLGIVIWEGSPRGSDDATADFLRQAKLAKFEIREISTRGSHNGPISEP